MKLFYNKDNVDRNNMDKEKENVRKEEFGRMDQKIRAKKISPFASALLGAITTFSLSFQACSHHDVVFDGGDADVVDARNDGDAGTDAGDKVDDAWDAGDEKDGGTDAEDEIDGEADGADGGVEEDGGMDAGDETIADGGDQTENGDQQTCEPRVDCNRTEEGEFTLFTINSEEIKETKASEQCVATAEDCSTSINDSLVFTLSRPLTPEEQQLFMNTHVPSALGVTTMYNPIERQFGNELEYNEHLKIDNTMINNSIVLMDFTISQDGVTSAIFLYGTRFYNVKSTDPPKQLGDANLYLKVYPGGSVETGIPVVALSDIKLTEYGRSVEVDGIQYYVLFEVDPVNNSNLTGMRLEKNKPATCDTRIRCNAAEAEQVLLFTINGEEIKETKTTENCVQLANDCIRIVSERISATLSRPLTPEEQQLFMNTHVPSALGVTTQYTLEARQFGNLAQYVEHLTCPGNYMMQDNRTIFFCGITNIYISPEGVTRVTLVSHEGPCTAHSNEPAVQCGTTGYWIKVYPGGSATEGVPVAFLTDVKMAEHGQTIQMNGKEYTVTIEAEQGNSANVARMMLYSETRAE